MDFMDPWIKIINVSLQGMFDLSRFMIGAGSGSDGEHEQGERSLLPLQKSGDVPSPKHEEGEWFKALRQDNTKMKSPEPEKDIEASDWSDCEEASGAVTNKLTESKFQDEEPEASCWSDGGDSYKLIENQKPIKLDKQENPQQNDPDSPVWSEDDLQSWSSNKNQNSVPIPNKNATPDQIPVCQTDSESEENAKFRQISTSPENLFKKSNRLSEEMSEDSYKPIQSMENVPIIPPTIPKYTSPEQQQFPRPLPRVSKTDDKSRRKITTVHKSNIDKKIEKLRRKVDEFEASEALTDSDYTDIDSNDSECSDTSNFEETPKKSEKLRGYVQREHLKKIHLKRIIAKLKEQKKNQRELIDDLITRNKVLDKDMTDSQSLLYQTHMKCTLTEDNLNTVKCLKGNLMDEIDNQSSIMLEKMTEVNQLKIKLREAQIENDFLHETIEKYSGINNSEDILKLKIDEAISQTQTDFNQKIFELEQAHLEKEKLWKEDHLKELQGKEKGYEIQIETLRDEQKSALINIEAEVSANLQNFKNERVKNDSLVSNITQLETKNSDLKEKLEDYLTKNKLLETNLDEKIQEISDLQAQANNLETVDSLKAQFSHMADTYEKKIERLEEDIETNADKLSQEMSANEEQLRDKDELINHLKKDLGFIRQDYEERMKMREAQFISEKETLFEKLDLMEQSKLNDVKDIDRLEKELKDQSEQIQEDCTLTEMLEGKSRECEEIGQELSRMTEKSNALLDENQNLKVNIQSLKQIVEKEKINNRLVYCCAELFILYKCIFLKASSFT